MIMPRAPVAATGRALRSRQFQGRRCFKRVTAQLGAARPLGETILRAELAKLSALSAAASSDRSSERCGGLCAAAGESMSCQVGTAESQTFSTRHRRPEEKGWEAAGATRARWEFERVVPNC